ncbi:MAG: BlaI/MecI/CopY family transcriptional regulator [Planctomycetota bacterium]
MVDKPEISPAEWQVMNVVYENQPVAASTVINELASENDWTSATVRTFLHRLVKKGALKYDQEGNRYFYRAAFSKSVLIKEASSSFLSSVFGGETGPLLTHFVKSSKLSKNEIESLQKLLLEKGSK